MSKTKCQTTRGRKKREKKLLGKSNEGLFNRLPFNVGTTGGPSPS
jgi:hypothetical protein